jgi:hypothetical protein
MPREIMDVDGTVWTCIQAFAGLGNDPDKIEAARVEGTDDRVNVVCTPTGGAQSVRVELPIGWEEVPDDRILDAVQAARQAEPSS